MLDYEGSKTSFALIVTATDNQNSSRKATAQVNITLDNLNESPYFDKESRDRVTGTNATTTYAEMRTNPVLQIAAVEPDGMGLRWELTGPDASDFAIEDVQDVNDGKDRRQLVFNIDPDYESGKGSKTSSAAAGATPARSNDVYEVTVRATEASAVGGGPNLAATLDVVVQVTNSPETGKVEFNWLQPEVGTAITAEVSDPDSPAGVTGTINYTWYRSKVTNPNRNPGSTDAALAGEWEVIEDEWDTTDSAECGGDGTASGDGANIYTPQGDCAETTADERTALGDEVDEGDYLLVRAVYTDGNGAATSTGITVHPVRNDISDDANNSPDFNANKVTREIAENAAIGDPVGAPVVVLRNEDDDVLTYELVENCRTNVDDTPCAATADPAPVLNANDGNNAVVPADVGLFSIDPATGQIMVNRKLSYEVESSDGGGFEADGSYTVVVRATDPSGDFDTTATPQRYDNRDDIVVTINVSDVNEAPRITQGAAELSVNEVNSTAKDTDIRKYVGLGYEVVAGTDGTLNTADDVQQLASTNPNLYKRTEEDLVDRAIWPEPIAGPDGGLFEYSIPADGIGRRLHFKNANRPDFENPMDANRDNVYEVTITVRDEDGAMGTKNVRVSVMNVDEMGKLVLSPEQPDDGMPVIATVTDPDGIVSITNWSWATATSTRVVGDTTATGASDANNDGANDVGPAWTVISEATASEYKPEAGRFVWAMVEYRDGHSVENDPVTALDERNDDPSTPAAGVAAVANDAEHKKYPGDGDSDGTITTTERGADALFHNSDRTRSKVTDNAVQPDPDDPDAPAGPSTGVEMISRMVYENVPSTGYVGVPLEDLGYLIPGSTEPTYRDTISGPDGSTFVFAEDYDHTSNDPDTTTAFQVDDFFVYYDASLTGPEVGTPATDVVDKRGQLALRPVTHLDAETKDTYIIEVSDPDATIAVSTYRITITVMDVNEAPTAPREHKGPPPVLNTAPMFLDANGDVATSTYRMVAENTAAGTDIGDPVMATDSDRGDQETLVYTLGGDDAASFTIASSTGQLSTSAPLDYETKNEFMVTVTATDDDEASSMINVTIMVTDVGLPTPYDMDESGTIDSTEVLMAVADYFAGDIDSVTVLDVVREYFAGL